jgi:hypothetical protein
VLVFARLKPYPHIVAQIINEKKKILVTAWSRRCYRDTEKVMDEFKDELHSPTHMSRK